MKDILLKLQTDLTLHLALIALITSMVIWRIKDVGMLLRQLRFLFLSQRNTLLPSYLLRQGVILKSQVCLRFLVIILLTILFILTFNYVKVLRVILSSEAIAFDMAIIESLCNKAEKVTVAELRISLIISLFLLVDIVFAVLLNCRYSTIEKAYFPLFTHQYSIPRIWRFDFESMWNCRMKQVHAELEIDIDKDFNNSWKNDWTVWAKWIVLYGTAVKKNGQIRQ